MKTLSKIAISVAAAVGIVLAAVAYAHGPGSDYGQGMGMMGPSGGGFGAGMPQMRGMHGGGPSAGMQGMHGGGPGYDMQGMHGGGPGYGVQGMHGGRPGYGMQDMTRGADDSAPCAGAERIGARLDAIESELELTAEQTPAWETFKDVVRTQMKTMLEAHPRSFQDENEHIAFMEQRLEGMKAVQKARTELYNVLTPRQKATVERYGMRGPHV